MGIFSNFFGPKRTPSSLQNFISQFGPDSKIGPRLIDETFEKKGAPGLTPIIVLMYSNIFFDSLYKDKLPEPFQNDKALLDKNFDTIIFETSAFLHYILLKNYLDESILKKNMAGKKGEPNYLPTWGGDPSFERLLMDSVNATFRLIQKMLSFAVNEKLYLERLKYYSKEVDGKSWQECGYCFQFVLEGSLIKGSPASINEFRYMLKGGIREHLQIFTLSYFEPMIKTVIKFYELDKTRRNNNELTSPAIKRLEIEISKWPRDQAQLGLEMVKAVLEGRVHNLEHQFGGLKFGYFKFVSEIIREIAKERGMKDSDFENL